MPWKIFVIIAALMIVPFFLLFQKKSLPLIKSNLFVNTNSPAFVPELPNLDQIFADNHDRIKNLPQDKLRTVIATGDIIPARSVNFQTTVRKDFTWPYFKTSEVLKNADITFVNLETPLIDRCPVTQEGMIFCGDTRNAEGLVYAGVDVVNLANNHAGNDGTGGIEATIKTLSDNNISTTGVDGFIIKDTRGIKFAFLGYNDISKPQPGISNMDEEKMKKEITAAKKLADIIVVTIHWGTEYKNQPDVQQKYLGHLAIDDGADLVIGNHPHWVQPVEIYKGKLITYAHGNFIFDQEWSLKTKLGVVGKYTFLDSQLIDVEFLPIKIEDYGQPHFLTGKEKEDVLNNMKLQSEILNSNPVNNPPLTFFRVETIPDNPSVSSPG